MDINLIPLQKSFLTSQQADNLIISSSKMPPRVDQPSTNPVILTSKQAKELIDQQSTNAMAYTIGLIVVILGIIIKNNHTDFNNKVYQSIYNITNQINHNTTDICILNKDTNLLQYNATNMMVIKRNTGEIKHNQTLDCYAPYTPTLDRYCLELVYYNTLNTSRTKSSNANAIVKWMFPNNLTDFKHIFECKYDPDTQTYIQPDYIAHICKTNQQPAGLAWLFLIVYLLVIYNHAKEYNYPYIIHDPATLNRKLTVKAECGITYEPIADDQTYYKCMQCTAVYDYGAYYKYWLSSKKCAYCAISVPLTPTQFKNTA